MTMQTAEHKTYTVVVNGQEKPVSQKELGFWDVVHLAFPDAQPSGTVLYTVAYRKGEDKKPKGTLVEGETVHVKDGMVFDVKHTNRS